LFRVWIEVVLVCLAVFTTIALRKDATLRATWRRSVLVTLCVVYIGWQVLLGIWALHRGWVDRTALLDGWTTELRFVGFLLIAWAVALKRPWLAARWRELLLLPAALVTAFGLLQASILPKDFLKHFGYGPTTIMPYETVDQNMNYVRLQSTLRGPNPLGAYIAFITTALVVLVSRKLRRLKRAGLLLFLAAGFVVLGLSYSRSAYIGAVVAIGCAIWLSLKSDRARKWLAVAACVLALLGGGAFIALRHNSSFDDTFFHTSNGSHSSNSSNAERTSSLEQGLRDIAHDPLGNGDGSAGLASQHNNHPARVSENYYLEIGEEDGWVGMALFVAIVVLLFMALWQRRSQPLVIVLLASLVGISCINMLTPAWADETLGVLWWGLSV